jgi:NADPH:quinone reductase-like Zn-dependent oxidoreductase
VRVRVAAAGVNPVDWKMREYEFLGIAQRILGPSGPLVVGIDVAGTVTEVGGSVSDFAVGDRVVGGTDFSKGERGSYAEEAVLSVENCAKIPDSIPLDVAGALPVAGATAWMALYEHGRLRERSDAKVLVLGAAGGVGHLAVQLAARAGAKVVGVCSTRNVAFVESLGGTALDYTKGDVGEAAKALGPFDIVLDAVGSDKYARAWCRRLLKEDGVHIHVVPRASDLPFLAFPGKTRTVLGRATRARLEGLLAAIAAGELRIAVAERIPLAEAERAHELSRGGKVVGKLVLVA